MDTHRPFVFIRVYPCSSVVKNPSVAVIDIGSNSIKVLVAGRAADGGVTTLQTATIEARISAGISQDDPRLGEEGMARGLDAIRRLIADAAPFSPAQTVLVATSAVRDAQNGEEFRARVLAATGHAIRILSGNEEASLIGRGLTCDPALRGLRDFYVFDLGGGSLECLAFRDCRLAQVASLQLGCVRLTEKFVAVATAPFAASAQLAIGSHTRDLFARSGFACSLPAQAVAIGTGGTVATARAVLGARDGKSFEQTDAVITIAQLRALLAWVGALPLAARRQVPGLPPARADVFPAALATLIAVAEWGGVPSYRNSLFNLRYGLAAAALHGSFAISTLARPVFPPRPG
ncbi:MAG: phosphatase [Verrucomicrobia bacterium]|nr:phosphatase [Verrucomicrobiota bacterium]